MIKEIEEIEQIVTELIEHNDENYHSVYFEDRLALLKDAIHEIKIEAVKNWA